MTLNYFWICKKTAFNFVTKTSESRGGSQIPFHIEASYGLLARGQVILGSGELAQGSTHKSSFGAE